jgi:hypothetical protein
MFRITVLNSIIAFCCTVSECHAQSCRLTTAERDKIASHILTHEHRKDPLVTWSPQDSGGESAYHLVIARSSALTFAREKSSPYFTVFEPDAPWRDALDIAVCRRCADPAAFVGEIQNWLKTANLAGTGLTRLCEVTLPVSEIRRLNRQVEAEGVLAGLNSQIISALRAQLQKLTWRFGDVKSIEIGPFYTHIPTTVGRLVSREKKVGTAYFYVTGDFRGEPQIRKVDLYFSFGQVADARDLFSSYGSRVRKVYP